MEVKLNLDTGLYEVIAPDGTILYANSWEKEAREWAANADETEIRQLAQKIRDLLDAVAEDEPMTTKDAVDVANMADKLAQAILSD